MTEEENTDSEVDDSGPELESLEEETEVPSLGFVAAIFSFVFNQEDSLILALLSSFFIAYLYELKTFDHETYYQKMRLILSTVVIISHIGVLIIN